MQPSSAEYWHIGATTTRLGSVMPPSWIGVNSFGDGVAGVEASGMLARIGPVGWLNNHRRTHKTGTHGAPAGPRPRGARDVRRDRRRGRVLRGVPRDRRTQGDAQPSRAAARAAARRGPAGPDDAIT